MNEILIQDEQLPWTQLTAENIKNDYLARANTFDDAETDGDRVLEPEEARHAGGPDSLLCQTVQSNSDYIPNFDNQVVDDILNREFDRLRHPLPLDLVASKVDQIADGYSALGFQMDDAARQALADQFINGTNDPALDSVRDTMPLQAENVTAADVCGDASPGSTPRTPSSTIPGRVLSI